MLPLITCIICILVSFKRGKKKQQFDLPTECERGELSLEGLQLWTDCLFLFLKLADVRCVAHICGLIHQVYADFSEPLKKGLLKMFDGYGGKEEEKVGVVSHMSYKLQVTVNIVFCVLLYGYLAIDIIDGVG